jgi:hypothetical protein
MRVLIVTRDNGKGLTRDTGIFAEVLLEAGCDVRTMGYDDRPPSRPVADVALFLELYHPIWSRAAGRNIIVPNQEWWNPPMNRFLSTVDMVLAKTKHAEQIFRGLGCAVEYTSMTSVDALSTPAKREDYCLHVPGNSQYKGTGYVIDAWRERPDFPLLKVVTRDLVIEGDIPANVEVIRERVDEARLCELQTGAMLNIHPSECEGWGHAIAESMSAGVPVVTTDGAPMNELVTPTRGYLAEWYTALPAGIGVRYATTGELLSETVARALSDSEGIELRGRASRQWWERNDTHFRRRIHEIFRDQS